MFFKGLMNKEQHTTLRLPHDCVDHVAEAALDRMVLVAHQLTTVELYFSGALGECRDSLGEHVVSEALKRLRVVQWRHRRVISDREGELSACF